MARGLWAVLCLAGGGCATDPLDRAFGPDGRTIRQEIETFPEEHRAAFELLRRRCDRCHSLDPVFASHIPAGTWPAQVRKMTRKPGAGIPPEDADRIVRFLEYLDSRRQGMTK